MKAIARYTLAAGQVLLLSTAAHAQNGCEHSPECPTAVLGVIGAAGAALYAKFRR